MRAAMFPASLRAGMMTETLYVLFTVFVTHRFTVIRSQEKRSHYIQPDFINK
jgi:hypothetical protein